LVEVKILSEVWGSVLKILVEAYQRVEEDEP